MATQPPLATFRCPNCRRTLKALAGARAWCDRTMCRVKGGARVMRMVGAGKGTGVKDTKGART